MPELCLVLHLVFPFKMDRCFKLSCFYFGIFCTLFFPTYTISVYNPRPIIEEIIILTEKVTDKLLHELDHHFPLDTLLKSQNWNKPHGCLGNYLETFEDGVKSISKNITHNDKVISILEHITNCTTLLKEHCDKVKKKKHHAENCENETKKRGIKAFMDRMLSFSKFLDRENMCHNIVHYKNYYDGNELLDPC
ncbi:uncharacterized protein LOC143773840 [Ranitomeya variabilis]|uniref:uncharacterized protein LOC143773840 n=1 Tax=Ranitomeya variabilis TaxID=490064 RepID=UPI004056BB29